MKKRMYLFIALFAGASGLYAQDCATGFCPSSITVHHKAGDVSPTGADITYKVVGYPAANPTACWTTSNLGASAEAASAADNASALFGWGWLFNQKQGYAVGSTKTLPAPVSSSAGTIWSADQDPCTILLGAGWHVPSITEWTTLGTAMSTVFANIKLASTGWVSPTSGVYATSNGYGVFMARNQAVTATAQTTWLSNGSVWAQDNSWFSGNCAGGVRCTKTK